VLADELPPWPQAAEAVIRGIAISIKAINLALFTRVLC
jgi:hypothetical protein